MARRNPFSFFKSSLPSGYFEVSGQSAKSHKRAAEPYSTQLMMGSAEEVVDHLRTYFKLSKKDAEAIIMEAAAMPPREFTVVRDLPDPRARAMVRFYAPFPAAKKNGRRRNPSVPPIPALVRLLALEPDEAAHLSDFMVADPMGAVEMADQMLGGHGVRNIGDSIVVVAPPSLDRTLVYDRGSDAFRIVSASAARSNPKRNYSYGYSEDEGVLQWQHNLMPKYGMEEWSALRGTVTYYITKYAGNEFMVTREEPGHSGYGLGVFHTLSRAKKESEKDVVALRTAYPSRYYNPSFARALTRMSGRGRGGLNRVKRNPPLMVGWTYRGYKVVEMFPHHVVLAAPRERGGEHIEVGGSSAHSVSMAIDEMELVRAMKSTPSFRY